MAAREECNDELIRKAVTDQLLKTDCLDTTKLIVEVSNGTVTVRGEVLIYLSDSIDREVIRGSFGITKVNNLLFIQLLTPLPIATDSELEKIVKNRLAENPDVDVSGIEVVVNNGHVTVRITVDPLVKKADLKKEFVTPISDPAIEQLSMILSTLSSRERQPIKPRPASASTQEAAR